MPVYSKIYLVLAKGLRAHRFDPQSSSFESRREAKTFKNGVQLVYACVIVTENMRKTYRIPIKAPSEMKALLESTIT